MPFIVKNVQPMIDAAQDIELIVNLTPRTLYIN